MLTGSTTVSSQVATDFRLFTQDCTGLCAVGCHIKTTSQLRSNLLQLWRSKFDVKQNDRCPLVGVFQLQTAAEEAKSGFIAFFILIFIEERYMKSHIYKLCGFTTPGEQLTVNVPPITKQA